MKLSLVLLLGVSFAATAEAAKTNPSGQKTAANKSGQHGRVGAAVFSCPETVELGGNAENQTAALSAAYGFAGSFTNIQEPKFVPKYDGKLTVTLTPSAQLAAGTPPPADFSYTVTCTYPKGTNYDAGTMTTTVKNPAGPGGVGGWTTGCQVSDTPGEIKCF